MRRQHRQIKWPLSSSHHLFIIVTIIKLNTFCLSFFSPLLTYPSHSFLGHLQLSISLSLSFSLSFFSLLQLSLYLCIYIYIFKKICLLNVIDFLLIHFPSDFLFNSFTSHSCSHLQFLSIYLKFDTSCIQKDACIMHLFSSLSLALSFSHSLIRSL